MQTLSIPGHVMRRVAVAADVDPRTVKHYCEGRAIRGMAGERIVRALKAEGLLPSVVPGKGDPAVAANPMKKG